MRRFPWRVIRESTVDKPPLGYPLPPGVFDHFRLESSCYGLGYPMEDWVTQWALLSKSERDGE